MNEEMKPRTSNSHSRRATIRAVRELFSNMTSTERGSIFFPAPDGIGYPIDGRYKDFDKNMWCEWIGSGLIVTDIERWQFCVEIKEIKNEVHWFAHHTVPGLFMTEAEVLYKSDIHGHGKIPLASHRNLKKMVGNLMKTRHTAGHEKHKTSNRVQIHPCPSTLQLYSQPPGAQVSGIGRRYRDNSPLDSGFYFSALLARRLPLLASAALHILPAI
jgi:hypothetical protein